MAARWTVASLLLCTTVPAFAIERTRHAVSVDKNGIQKLRRESEMELEHQQHLMATEQSPETGTSGTASGQPLFEPVPNAASDPTALGPAGEAAAAMKAHGTNPLDEPDAVATQAAYQGAAAGPPVVPLTSEAQAEEELQKETAIVERAEEKAGLPDSTKTTPEPYLAEPDQTDQEGMAMMVILISIVVLIGTCSAGWSIYQHKKGTGKGEAEERLKGEGEGEATEGAETEAEPKADDAAPAAAAAAEPQPTF